MFQRLVALALLASALAWGAEDLDSKVKAALGGAPGHVTLYAKELSQGAVYGIDPDTPVRTASTIKLAILVECFAEAGEGKLDLNEPIELLEGEKVSGSGIVQELTSGTKLPLRDVLDLMVVLSDNTATNLVLNRIGGDAVNARMASFGLTQTRVMRKILGDGNKLKPVPTGITGEGAKPENKRWGIGRSSPHEMVTLLEKMYHGELVSKAASEQMLDILKRQRDRNGIGRDMQDIEIASKSGALDHLRSDVGIIYSKRGPIAMAITIDDLQPINWTPDNPGLLLLSRLSALLVDGLPIAKP